ncbi:MAG: flagellar export chaperone FlgN [Reinekea sp.]|nr:flagellar export chaperone FlgN [Reinekea sp.]
MNAQQLVQFQETLRASILIAQEFSELLVKEKKQLTSTQLEPVTALLEQKNLLIKQLSGYQAKILDFCSQADIEPSYSAMRSLLYRSAVANAESILADWTLLRNALIKNEALNKTNEAILNELLRRNQIKQSIIHGLGRKSDTYTATGQTNKHSELGWVEQV